MKKMSLLFFAVVAIISTSCDTSDDQDTNSTDIISQDDKKNDDTANSNSDSSNNVGNGNDQESPLTPPSLDFNIRIAENQPNIGLSIAIDKPDDILVDANGKSTYGVNLNGNKLADRIKSEASFSLPIAEQRFTPLGEENTLIISAKTKDNQDASQSYTFVYHPLFLKLIKIENGTHIFQVTRKRLHSRPSYELFINDNLYKTIASNDSKPQFSIPSSEFISGENKLKINAFVYRSGTNNEAVKWRETLDVLKFNYQTTTTPVLRLK